VHTTNYGRIPTRGASECHGGWSCSAMVLPLEKAWCQLSQTPAQARRPTSFPCRQSLRGCRLYRAPSRAARRCQAPSRRRTPAPELGARTRPAAPTLVHRCPARQAQRAVARGLPRQHRTGLHWRKAVRGSMYSLRFII
jgi:hypothetical protein